MTVFGERIAKPVHGISDRRGGGENSWENFAHDFALRSCALRTSGARMLPDGLIMRTFV